MAVAVEQLSRDQVIEREIRRWAGRMPSQDRESLKTRVALFGDADVYAEALHHDSVPDLAGHFAAIIDVQSLPIYTNPMVSLVQMGQKLHEALSREQQRLLPEFGFGRRARSLVQGSATRLQAALPSGSPKLR